MNRREHSSLFLLGNTQLFGKIVQLTFFLCKQQDNGRIICDIIRPMEKDYFPDRSILSTRYDAIHIGQSVFICEKKAQKTAKEIDDLTHGVVIQKLTRHDHPRGVKVKIRDDNGQIKVGRIVYVF